MRRDVRESVRESFDFCCGYCGVGEEEVGAALTLDHFQPRSQGGSDELENLVYACHACNEFKSDFWPASGQTRFLHPRTDDLTLHIRALTRWHSRRINARRRFVDQTIASQPPAPTRTSPPPIRLHGRSRRKCSTQSRTCRAKTPNATTDPRHKKSLSAGTKLQSFGAVLRLQRLFQMQNHRKNRQRDNGQKSSGEEGSHVEG